MNYNSHRLNDGAPFLHHFLIRRPFPAHAGHCGGVARRAPAAPPTSPLTLTLSPRDGGFTRTTSPGIQRAHSTSMWRIDFWETESPPVPPAFWKTSCVLEIPASAAAIWFRPSPAQTASPAPFRPAPRRDRSRSPSGGVRWRRRSGPRGSGLAGWAGRSWVPSSPRVSPVCHGAWRV